MSAVETAGPTNPAREQNPKATGKQQRKLASFAPRARLVVPDEEREILAEPIQAGARGVANDAGQVASDKNQIMDDLLNQPAIPSDYGDSMIALFRDKSQDIVTRDFAVQHIGLYAQALSRRGVYDAHSADARNCRAALIDAADETRTIVAAAAFRALADLACFDPNVDVRDFESRLVSCAADGTASVAARVMATQICGERRVSSARPALVRLASGPATPEPLRRAAAFALRATAAPPDTPTLGDTPQTKQ